MPIRLRPFVAAMGLCLAARARGETGDIDAAQRLAAAGQLSAAVAVFDGLLAADARRTDAQLGRAYVRAFQRDYARARADFEDVLAREPANLGALTGLGYVFAWSGSYADAEQKFARALDIAPGQADATKGLAYVALWRGDAPEAERRFGDIAAQDPRSAEVQVGLGRSLLAGGRAPEARAAFARALELDPSRADARDALAAPSGSALRWDATIFGGLTDVRDSAKGGLRFAELAVSPAASTRFWVQVDDSLSLDNVSFASRNTHAPSYYAGGLASYGERERFATRLEAGFRSLPREATQALVRGEQVMRLDAGTALRAGAWVAVGAGRVESLGHAGASVPLSSHLRLEPTLFYGRSGFGGEHEVRAQLASAYRFTGGVELGAGAAAGHAFSPIAVAEGTVASAFARASAPIGGLARGHLLVTHERPATGPTTTVYALGLSVALGGRP